MIKEKFPQKKDLLREIFATFSLKNLPSSLFPLNITIFSLSLGTLFTLPGEEFSALRLISFSDLFCIYLQISSCYFQKLERTQLIDFLELYDSFKIRRDNLNLILHLAEASFLISEIFRRLHNLLRFLPATLSQASHFKQSFKIKIKIFNFIPEAVH